MKVGIVGMGAAGIRTAMLLEEAGCDVRLFEARDRVGGRLCTVTGPGGLIYDAGGEWIDADHHRILALAQMAGVEPDPRPRWPGLVHYRGEQCLEDDLWPDALLDEVKFEATAKDLAEALDDEGWRNGGFSEFDAVSLAEFIDQNAESDRGKWWLRRRYGSDEGDDVERVSLLGWLHAYRQYLGRETGAMSAFRVEGGMGALFENLAASLKTPVLKEKVLRRVIDEGRSLLLQFDDGETHVDRVVLCLPPPVLERVVFDPPLPAEKRCALESCEMSRTIKIALEFRTPWWLETPWKGSLICDLPIQQTWDGTRGERPVLQCYIGGKDTQRFCRANDPVHEAVRCLARLFPEAEAEFVDGAMYDWHADTFAMGGFSLSVPGYLLRHSRHIATPVGRIHFAGEHTAKWVGFIEGALESAERVAQEVIACA